MSKMSDEVVLMIHDAMDKLEKAVQSMKMAAAIHKKGTNLS